MASKSWKRQKKIPAKPTRQQVKDALALFALAGEKEVAAPVGSEGQGTASNLDCEGGGNL